MDSENVINDLEMGKEKDREWEILLKIEFLEGWDMQGQGSRYQPEWGGHHHWSR